MKKGITGILLLLILSSCGIGERYELKGSSDNWEVFYAVEVSSHNDATGTGTLEYTGAEPIPEKFDYMIHYKQSGSGTTNNELTDRNVNFGNFRCESCYFDEDDEIEVEINWDGKKENIFLKTTND